MDWEWDSSDRREDISVCKSWMVGLFVWLLLVLDVMRVLVAVVVVVVVALDEDAAWGRMGLE